MRAHGTHCGRFLCVCLGAIRRALPKDTVANTKGKKKMPSWGPKRGRKCYVTPATSPLHSRGSPNKGGQNQNWLPHPCLLGGPKEDRKAMSSHAFSGVPKQRGAKSELAASPVPSRGSKRGQKSYVTPAFSGVPKQRGAKSELATSPLPSRGPRRGRKCYVTPAFSGVPNAKRGNKIRSGPLMGTSPTGTHFQ